ncbi:MAG: 2-oxoacid:acceptor oxidoreductase subunit alpha [Desulfovibrio sp.]|jgi:2-oxoglutarate ferredoxin oxidoreductase subunit alpha|nr:2-oxoacid:acceptor oxidoreductase subunit alpha [Desulfovibrio sp.]
MAEPRVRTGNHFQIGNWAIAEGALAAGCDFAAGYPITPASEVANYLAARLPEVGGVFIQSEDEISACCSAVGASWAGRRAMTVTSGPGISLMQETIGFAVATETPLVIVDVQRFGPSTGVPSIGLAADMVQVARGSHGDYQIIALAPDTPQAMFTVMIRAFDLAERFRVPVFVMADGFAGHMRERISIPEASSIAVGSRKIAAPAATVLERADFLDEDVAPMPVFGRGLKAHVTSSCHDAHGMRNLTDPESMHAYSVTPVRKILKHRDEIVRVEETRTDDAELIIVSYGTVSRCGRAALEIARREGLAVGQLRLETCWPLPDREIRRAAERAKHLLVLENNLGQMLPYIQACAGDSDKVRFTGPKLLGQIQEPDDIVGTIREIMA